MAIDIFMKFKKTGYVEDWMKSIFILCKLLSPANNEKLSMNTYYITYRFLEFLYKVYNNQHLGDSHARVKNTHPIMYICGFINHFLIWNEWTRFFSLKGTVGVLSLKKAGIGMLLTIYCSYIHSKIT